MTPKTPKPTSRYRQLLRKEKALLKIVPLADQLHRITRQHKKRSKKQINKIP